MTVERRALKNRIATVWSPSGPMYLFVYCAPKVQQNIEEDGHTFIHPRKSPHSYVFGA